MQFGIVRYQIICNNENEAIEVSLYSISISFRTLICKTIYQCLIITRIGIKILRKSDNYGEFASR